MLQKIIVITIFIAVVTGAKAQQLKSFTNKPETFIDEVNSLFEKSKSDSKKDNTTIETFITYFTANKISDHRKQNIYNITNLLLQKKARTYPHFYDYFDAIITFYSTNTDSLKYVEWEKGLIFLLNDKKSKLTQIQNYINSIKYLLTDNILQKSSAMSWKATNTNYKLLFDNDTLKIIFDNTDLICYLRRDSIVINNTNGIFYQNTNIFKGKSATVYWEKAGLDKQTAYAQIDNYSIDLTKPEYSIPNVKFYNKTHFDYAIEGTLTDKVIESRTPDLMPYPKFESNQKQFEIKGLFNDIDYMGGFTMQGAKLLGSGTKDNFATLSFWRDTEVIKDGDTIIEKRVFLRTYSLFYSLKNDEIYAKNAKISVYIDTDSIYHPGLLLKYFDKNREINLIRDNDPENMSRSPYYNSYHMIEMDYELFVWKMDQPTVEISMLRGSAINIANFESVDFFNAQRYYEVQGLEDIHPYVQLRAFARKNGSQSFYAEDFSRHLRLGLTTTRRLLIELTYRGIVDYDFETEFCTIKPKLYKYLDAIVGRRDYDLIAFESRTQGNTKNATLNLYDMSLAIAGVPEINVSDSQNVIFYPKNEQILLKKNRNFDFSGRIEAGYFTFYGNNFEFKYDSFRIELNKIDSLTIKVQSGVNNWGQKMLSNVQSVIEEISGNLVIDDPTNKSGVKKYPRYPVFESEKESFVYYDDNHVQNGKYTRDRFFFVIDPYVIDSLNSFSTQGMGYKGRLVSSDIFPVIEQTLVLQPDNSLGFLHQTPNNGLPVFKGKGLYMNQINLSNQGLRGNGELKYLTSKTTAPDFIFYPDSANVIAATFNIGKQTSQPQYPLVDASKVYIHWMPYVDHMHAKTIETPFNMYNKLAEHTGTIDYTPKGLTGKGTVNYFNAALTASLLTFNADKFKTDSADFKLNSVNTGAFALTTNNVNAKVDFITMRSDFKSNTGTSRVNLDENLYIAFAEQLSWLMEKKKVQISTPNTTQIIEKGKTRIVELADAGLTPKGSLFVSVHKSHDSLNWVSPIADFDLATNIINAHKVKFIDVADASVFPDQGEVTVEPMARIKTLKNAKVTANRATKFHSFHTASININSRHNYHGEGLYNYYDENGRESQIQFTLIAVDSAENTFARGKIKGIDDFSLSPAFKYQGNVSLYAPDKFLHFNGHTLINHNCSAFTANWVSFENSIDPKNIMIPISVQPKDINDHFLVSGPMVATDSVHVFPSFLSPRKLYSNVPVITADGFLRYNKKDKRYEIASAHKLANNDTTGNMLSLHSNFCILYGEGDINLTTDLGQFKTVTKGNALYDLPNDKLTLDLLMTVDFFFPEKAIQFVADTLTKLTGLKPLGLLHKNFIKNVNQLLPYTEADQMLKEQKIFGSVKKLPELLSTTFVFSDLNMRWDKNQRSWISTGDLGILNIAGTQINRKVKGVIEVQRRRSGDSFTLYIEIAENHWYFFNYKRGLMQAYSTEAGFNTIIADIKGTDRKMKIEKGQQSFVFFLSNTKKRNDFLKRIKGDTTGDDIENADELTPEEQEMYEYEEFE